MGMIIGTVSFVGSMIAWGKLAGTVKDLNIPAGQILNFIVLAGIVALTVVLLIGGVANPKFYFYSIGYYNNLTT